MSIVDPLPVTENIFCNFKKRVRIKGFFGAESIYCTLGNLPPARCYLRLTYFQSTRNLTCLRQQTGTIGQAVSSYFHTQCGKRFHHGCTYRRLDSNKVASINKKFSLILKNRLKMAKKRQLVIVRIYFSLLFHQTPYPLTAVAIEGLIMRPSTTKTPPRLMKKFCARASSAVDPAIVYRCVKCQRMR